MIIMPTPNRIETPMNNEITAVISLLMLNENAFCIVLRRY
tara:strand:+ start:308 stop:427 length:120 start_codon:yes stop_codon:yes gene_type:complete